MYASTEQSTYAHWHTLMQNQSLTMSLLRSGSAKPPQKREDELMFALRSGSAKPSHMRIRLYPSTVGLLEATADTLPSNPALRSGYSKPPQWDPTGTAIEPTTVGLRKATAVRSNGRATHQSIYS